MSAAAVAEVVRSGLVEGRHTGSVVALNGDGSVAFALGDALDPIFPRSANKPLQAAGMLRSGLELDGELLALVAASHDGEPAQIRGVRRILAMARLDEADLQTPADLPMGDSPRDDWVRDGRDACPIAMNCSGKHAGMLAACLVNGWPTDTYLQPDHPLQLMLLATVEELSAEPVAATGVDRCGAPLFAISLTALARAFRALALAPAGSPEGRVARAMRDHPEYVGGADRDVTQLMRGVPGLLAKEGAEAVYAAALPDGRAVALKIHDGGDRARAPVMVEALRRLGVDAEVLDEQATVSLEGGGRTVGEVHALVAQASRRPAGTDLPPPSRPVPPAPNPPRLAGPRETTDADAEVLVLPLLPGGDQPKATIAALERLGDDPERIVSVLRSTGGGPCHVLPSFGRLGSEAVVLAEVAESTSAGLRDAALAAASACAGRPRIAVALTAAAPSGRDAAEAVVEGLTIGLGRSAGAAPEIELVDPRLTGEPEVERALATGEIVGRAVDWVRRLVDAPPGEATPLGIAEAISARAAGAGVECRIHTDPSLEAERLAGLLAIGATSPQPPCLVELHHRGDGGPRVALVGKGITFDSGGLHLKPPESMENQKRDMAGAAAVAGALLATAELGMPVDVTALIPLAENMLGHSGGLRPGDVIHHRNGVTSEVISPDTEGRLLLADCLALAAESRPDAIVDAATLTGGGGLGPELWAVLGTDRELVAGLLAAGERSGDEGWELPLRPSYRRLLESPVADLRNLGHPTRYDLDTLLAALFLERFTDGVPWAHLDISAAAARDSAFASAAWPDGATGSPTRALVSWLRSLRPAAGDPLGAPA